MMNLKLMAKKYLVEIPTGVGFVVTYIRRDLKPRLDILTKRLLVVVMVRKMTGVNVNRLANFHQLNVFVYHKGGVSSTLASKTRTKCDGTP